MIYFKTFMEIITRINWTDLVILILILRISYVAWAEGFSHEILPLLGSIIITVLSLHYYVKIGGIISRNLFSLSADISNFLSFLMLVVAAGFIARFVKALLERIVKVSWHPLIEKFGGLVCGIARASIVASLVMITISLTPLPYLQRSIRERSLSGIYFLKIGPTIYYKVSRFLPTVKIEAPGVTQEALINDITKDKSILQKTDKKADGVPERKD